MRAVVIDASVAVALVLDEPAGFLAEQTLRSWVAGERQMFVPSHFWLEVVNSLGKAQGAPGQRVLAAVHRLDGFGLQTLEPDRPLLLQVIDRVERLRLSAYDAMYLVLAE